MKDLFFFLQKSSLPLFLEEGLLGRDRREAAKKSSNPSQATSCSESQGCLFVIRMGSRGLGKIAPNPQA